MLDMRHIYMDSNYMNTKMRKTMIEADNTKLSYVDYEKKPGMLSAKIVFNILVKSNYKVFAIGHVNGSLLFNVAVGPTHFATTLFTSKELAISFCNKKDVKKLLCRNYGKTVVILDTSLVHLSTFINPDNATYLNTVIVNPNKSDFFIPIHLGYFSRLVEENKVQFNAEDDDFDLNTVEFDDSTKEYCLVTDDNPFKG